MRTSGHEGKILYQGNIKDISFFNQNPLMYTYLEKNLLILVLNANLYENMLITERNELFVYGKV